MSKDSLGVREEFALTLRTLALSLSHEHAEDSQRRTAQQKINEAFGAYEGLAKNVPEFYQREYGRTAYLSALIYLARRKTMRGMLMYETAADALAKALEAYQQTGLDYENFEDTHPDLTRGPHNRITDHAEEYRQVVSETVAAYEQRGKQRQARAIRERHQLAA